MLNEFSKFSACFHHTDFRNVDAAAGPDNPTIFLQYTSSRITKINNLTVVEPIWKAGSAATKKKKKPQASVNPRSQEMP